MNLNFIASSHSNSSIWMAEWMDGEKMGIQLSVNNSTKSPPQPIRLIPLFTFFTIFLKPFLLIIALEIQEAVVTLQQWSTDPIFLAISLLSIHFSFKRLY